MACFLWLFAVVGESGLFAIRRQSIIIRFVKKPHYCLLTAAVFRQSGVTGSKVAKKAVSGSMLLASNHSPFRQMSCPKLPELNPNPGLPQCEDVPSAFQPCEAVLGKLPPVRNVMHAGSNRKWNVVSACAWR